jgi:hypothetical protein
MGLWTVWVVLDSAATFPFLGKAAALSPCSEQTVVVPVLLAG